MPCARPSATAAGQQRLIRTISRKGLRFVGSVSEMRRTQTHRSSTTGRAAPALRQDVRFTTAADGVRIAYAVVGHGPPLVRTGHWLTHLEYDWESPVWNPFLRTMAERNRLIRYDARGNGLSDRDVADISFDAFVRDLESVVEAVGLQRFPLFGISQAASRRSPMPCVIPSVSVASFSTAAIFAAADGGGRSSLRNPTPC